MKKLVSLAPCALLVFALAGCSHHESTADGAARPAAPSADNTNTFGDDKTKATGDAEHARDQSYGSGSESTPPAPGTDQPNGAPPPK